MKKILDLIEMYHWLMLKADAGCLDALNEACDVSEKLYNLGHIVSG